MAGWGEGKGWVATKSQSLVLEKERGTGSWDIREEILRNPGLCLGGGKKGRYSSSSSQGWGEGLIRMACSANDGDGAE